MAATTFTLFHLLPKELRLHIWQKALPNPRMIEVSYTKHEAGTLWHYFTNYEFLDTSLTLVDSEANGVFNTAYEPVKAIDLDRSHNKFGTVKIDFNRDTVYLSANAYAALCAYFERWLAPGILILNVNGTGSEDLREAQWTTKARNIAVNWRIMRNRDLMLNEQYSSPAERERAARIVLDALKIFPKARPLMLVVHEWAPIAASPGLARLVNPFEVEDWEGSFVNQRIVKWIPEKLAEMQKAEGSGGVIEDVVYKCLLNEKIPDRWAEIRTNAQLRTVRAPDIESGSEYDI